MKRRRLFKRSVGLICFFCFLQKVKVQPVDGKKPQKQKWKEMENSLPGELRSDAPLTHRHYG